MPSVTPIDSVRTQRPYLTTAFITELIDPDARVDRAGAARALGVSVATLERWAMIGSPRLRYFILGKRAYYLKSDLAEFIDRQAYVAGGAA